MVRGSDEGAATVGSSRLGYALGLFVLWSLATWLLEGRLLTLLRPEAARARLLYAVVANVLIGTVLAGAVLRRFVRRGAAAPAALGLASARRTGLGVLAGGALGMIVFVAQRPPTLEPVVLLNGFSQTLVVSIAEVLVCWAVLGGAVLASTRAIGSTASMAAALVVSAGFFGVYHFAHSPPFDSLRMVMLLTAVGLVTGIFFFTMRDVYGTVLFHNFLALTGVTRALAESDRLADFASVQRPLIGTAAASIVVLVLTDRLLVRAGERATDDEAV